VLKEIRCEELARLIRRRAVGTVADVA